MSDSTASRSNWVVETSQDRFQVDVVERSKETLVLVDFWAPWCAPCRALGPVLEKLASQFAGRVALVKVNTDELPQLAVEFKVQGIPAVFAVRGGEVVDFFTGALPETQMRAWLERILSVCDLAEASRLEQDDPSEAERCYRRLLDSNPKLAEARIGLARILHSQGKIDASRAEIETLEQRGFLEPEAQKIKSALELGQKSAEGLDECRAAAAAASDNLGLQLQLAEALVGAQQFEESLRICLSLVERDRQGVGEKARQLMIDIFRVLPEDSELTPVYRRKLSMALF